jgi:glycosyltransferase involved in cell wall biosynthesis
MFNNNTVHIVIPAYNEEATIAEVVTDFLAEPDVDCVVVVDNNCKDDTHARAKAAGAMVIQESEPGYGCAIRAGLDHASANGADILVIVEADGSFRSSDLPKQLHYLSDCRMVLGTRTTRQMVQQGANMDKLLRWGNVTMAKLLELCWYLPHEPRLTDVGCSYRAIWADAWTTIRPGTTEAGPSFSPEMICEAYRKGLRVIEIPVAYGARLGGESKHSDSFMKVAGTATGMFKAIMRKRFFG